MAISGNQWQSEALGRTRSHSAALRGTQGHSAALSGYLELLELVRNFDEQLAYLA